MTITTNPSRNEFIASAAQTVFNYTFKIYTNLDLDVFVTPFGSMPDDSTDLTTDLVVDPGTIGNEDGGFITFNSGLNAGDAVTIVSSIDFDRLTDYQINGDFIPLTVNDDFDRNVSLTKQVLEDSNRGLVFQQSVQNASGLELEAPEALKFLRWKTDLTGMENVDISTLGSVAEQDITKTYTNVAEMVGDTTIQLGRYVRTNGYFLDGDGGDNVYLIVAAGTGVDDTGSFIDLNTLQAQGLFPGSVYNIRQWDISTVTGLNASQTYVNSIGGGQIEWTAGTYTVNSSFIPKAQVVNNAVFGTVILKLADGADTNLVESFLFDTLYAAQAFQVSDNPDMTLDYGFRGFIFDANKDNQTLRKYAVKMYGRRLVLSHCIITNSKGVGIWTALLGSASGTFDFTKTKSPGEMEEIAIIDCEEEGWIFEGPSDQDIGNLLINLIGDQSNDGTVPQTSTHFPGQPVHGLRLEDSATFDSMNLNGVRFGRCLYITQRINADRVILAGGWGNLWAISSAFGSIGQLITQANPNDWTGLVFPSVLVETDDLQISNGTFLRVAGQDQPTAPLIKDSGGCNWGIIRNRQSLTEGGVFFEADANGINIDSMNVAGAAVALLTNSTCNRINFTMEFDNCDLVWDNNRTDIRGAWDMTGSITAAQTFATGIDASPNADEESLSNARMEFLDDGTFVSNSFRGAVTWDSTTTNGQSIVATHGMWRAPKAEEIQLTARVSGFSTEPAGMSLTINGFNATIITARVKLDTAATGSPASTIIYRVN